MAGKQQTTVEQRIYVSKRASFEVNASQIHREMAHVGLLSHPHPMISTRTVQDLVKKQRVRDTSDPWSLAEADRDQSRLVLDVVAWVFETTEGRVWPTKDLVAHLARIREAVPDIPPLWAYYMALAYRRCAASSRDSRHLDFALGLRPWESLERAEWLAEVLGWSEPLAPAALPILLSMDSQSLTDMAKRFPQTSLGEPISEPKPRRQRTHEELLAWEAMGGVVENQGTHSSVSRPSHLSSPLEPLDFDNLGASLSLPPRKGGAE